MKYGVLTRFLQIESTIFVIVRKSKKKRAIANDLELESRLDNFYQIGLLTNEYQILKINQIVNKM